MYKLHLILKYLLRRRIAWWSLLAVTLCTTMVLVVISVMGGWLNMFENSFHGLTGDIIVGSTSLSGFPWYQQMIERIEKQPGIEAAVPTIRTFGLINIGNAKQQGVQVLGLPIEKIGRVNQFPESLYRQYQQYVDAAKDAHLTPQERQALLEKAAYGKAHPSFKLPLPAEEYRRRLPESPNDPSTFPGIICGSMVVDIRRNEKGETVGRDPFLYRTTIKLTVLGIRPGESSLDLGQKNETVYWMVDDSHTALWQYDNQFVYVPFEELQKDLHMEGEKGVIDEQTGKEIELPSRTSEIHVRVKPGTDLNAAKLEVEDAVHHVLRQQRGQDFVVTGDPFVETWKESQHVWINAIENEKLLTVFLFSIMSIVAIFLVFCIFYMIVVEKTKDIGIIKSVGATSSGVAGIFLGYGLVIGICGAMMGLLLSYLIVHNINALHAQLGHWFGVQIWNPEVYLFDKIPNQMSMHDIAIIVPVAIVSSVLGALMPALRAARMHPVEALRWE